MNPARFEDRGLQRAEEQILRSRNTAIELLEELVQIPTTNPPGAHYLECALLLAERLRDLGFDPRIVDVPTRELERLGLPSGAPRPAVLASLGADAEAAPTLHFHGHYDVVPADSADAFRLVVRGDTAYGRGTADMKGGLVSLLLALAALRPLAERLAGRVLLSLVPDEETGGAAGTGYLFRSGILEPGGIGMLMPEPTGGTIWNGSRGACSLLLRILGRPAHVAVQHQGQNAFEGMLALGQALLALKREVEQRSFGPEELGLEGPPSSLLLGGLCRGGTNFNVVPEDACFSIDRRFHPQESRPEVLRELEALFRRFRRQGWRLEVETLQEGDASLTPRDAPLGRTLVEVIASLPMATPRFRLCPGILETRFFLQHGIPGFALGPGELEVSHGPRERVSIQRILEIARVYARTAWALLAPPPAKATRRSSRDG